MNGQSWSPEIAASGNNLYVVWYDNTEDYQDSEIFVIKSSDNGASWSSTLRITNDNKEQQYPFIAAKDNWVYIIWDDRAEGKVYFAKSDDFGKHFQYYPLTPQSGISRGSDIMVDHNGTIHVLWYDNRQGHTNLYYKKSSDHGASWSQEVCLTCTFGDIDNEQGKIREDKDGILHVIYRSNPNGDPQGGMPPYDFYHIYSLDGGNTWTQAPLPVTPALPSSYSNEYSGNFVISGDRFFFSCYTETTQNQVILIKGQAKGCMWNYPPTNISKFSLNYEPSFAEHNYPAMALTSSGKLHIVFMQSLKMMDTSTILYGPLFHVIVDTEAGNISSPDPIPEVTVGLNPKMVYNQGKLHLVYSDYRDNNYGAEIYYQYYEVSP